MARSGRANAGAATAVAGQELEIEDINELEELEDV